MKAYLLHFGDSALFYDNKRGGGRGEVKDQATMWSSKGTSNYSLTKLFETRG